MLYMGEQVSDGCKADVVAAEQIILEIKSVSTILTVHEVQPRSYHRISGIRVVLLLNFHAPRLMDGCRRFAVWWSAHDGIKPEVAGADNRRLGWAAPWMGGALDGRHLGCAAP